MLCDLLQPYAQAKTTNWRKPIELENTVAVVFLLFFLNEHTEHQIKIFQSLWHMEEHIEEVHAHYYLCIIQYTFSPLCLLVDYTYKDYFDIIASTKDLTRISHMCYAIDGTHINLA